jgi:hypothetical protein
VASSLLDLWHRARVTHTMTGRRRHARYLLAEPIDGRLRVREEVAIERWDARELVVLSSTPSHQDDVLTFELPGVAPRHVLVKVISSKPIVAADGSLRHRVRLALENGNGGHAL